jgi:hypothetical protein
MPVNLIKVVLNPNSGGAAVMLTFDGPISILDMGWGGTQFVITTNAGTSLSDSATQFGPNTISLSLNFPAENGDTWSLAAQPPWIAQTVAWPANGLIARADCIGELIAQNLLTTLGGIVGTPAAGVRVGLAAAERRKLPYNVPSDRLAVLVAGDLLGDAQGTAQENEYDIVWEEPYSIVLYSIDTADPPETRFNAMLADVGKAVMADVTRGGVANWTVPRGLGFIDLMGEEVAVATFTVEYRHIRGRSFAQ